MIKYSDTKTIYKSEQSLPLIIIEDEYIYAVIAMQGAQILEFKVKGRGDFFWLSHCAIFEEKKAIRGGVPICAPWFGVHSDKSKPKHGFVRNNLWTLTEGQKLKDGAYKLVFMYEHKADEVYEYDFVLNYEIILSSHLDLKMSVTNASKFSMPFSWAFHSYHPVDDLKMAKVTGLEGVAYLDATNSLKSVKQIGPVIFEGEVDRVYENVQSVQKIINGEQIALTLSGQNCPTAIIWNPGNELALKMEDVGPEGYLRYICVERGAAFGDTWNIPCGEKREAKLRIEI